MINTQLVKQLIIEQFPQYQEASIEPVKLDGHDHRTFHLGSTMSVRLPSHKRYQKQVIKEYEWLPFLQKKLDIRISTPLHLGKPSELFPMPFGIYQWIEGSTIQTRVDSCSLAHEVSQFLKSFESISTTNGPLPSLDNFYRGGSLMVYDDETRLELNKLSDQELSKSLLKQWENALASNYNNPPVWVHGDMAGTNLLIHQSKLVGVIDFGGLAIGDPACDLTIAWTLFMGESRALFMKEMEMDDQTWQRAKGWAIWKALLVYHHDSSLIKREDAYQLLQELKE